MHIIKNLLTFAKNLLMKKYIYLAVVAIICLLSLCLVNQCTSTNKYKALYEKELQNVEAYQVANSGLEGEIRQQKMTISDLYSSLDSIDKKLVTTMQQLKISDNKVKEMQYQLGQASRIDTIIMSDTILISNVNIDTTIGDYWYNMRLQLKYPSTIITTPTFNSEQYIYIYNEKKYVGGKSKWFFINWFKKKYISTEVKIEEKNPYIKTINQKFIEIE